jgi:hypothetical protein
MFSKGHAWLAALDGTQAQKAERFGVARGTVVRWLSGDSPAPEQRRHMRDLGGPPEIAWDEPAAVPEARAPSEPPLAAPASPEAARAAADATHALILAELEACQQPRTDLDGETPAKRSARVERLVRNVVMLGKMTGAADVDEPRVAASPAFRRMCDRLADALAPWPDALAAAIAALEPT